MADDLDGFFDDIEQIEAAAGDGVVEETVASGKKTVSVASKTTKRAKKPAAEAVVVEKKTTLEFSRPNAPSTKRKGAGKTWVDDSLKDYPPNSWLIFVGNLANDAHDKHLASVFEPKYPSFIMARVVRNKPDPSAPHEVPKSKGYGFACFGDALEMAKALREMNGKLCRSRPMMLKKSTANERNSKRRKRR